MVEFKCFNVYQDNKSRYQIEFFADRCPGRQFQFLNHGK